MPLIEKLLPHDLPESRGDNMHGRVDAACGNRFVRTKKGLDAFASSPENVPEAANPRGAEDSSYFRGRLVVCVTPAICEVVVPEGETTTISKTGQDRL